MKLCNMNIGFTVSPSNSLNICKNNCSSEVQNTLITFGRLGANFQDRFSEVSFAVSLVSK
jgi:hypothetical protein